MILINEESRSFKTCHLEWMVGRLDLNETELDHKSDERVSKIFK